MQQAVIWILQPSRFDLGLPSPILTATSKQTNRASLTNTAVPIQPSIEVITNVAAAAFTPRWLLLTPTPPLAPPGPTFPSIYPLISHLRTASSLGLRSSRSTPL